MLILFRIKKCLLYEQFVEKARTQPKEKKQFRIYQVLKRMYGSDNISPHKPVAQV